MEAGRLELARIYYSRSLELNPANANALEKIRELARSFVPRQVCGRQRLGLLRYRGAPCRARRLHDRDVRAGLSHGRVAAPPAL